MFTVDGETFGLNNSDGFQRKYQRRFAALFKFYFWSAVFEWQSTENLYLLNKSKICIPQKIMRHHRGLFERNMKFLYRLICHWNINHFGTEINTKV